MNQFYVSIIFMGILLILVSLGMIAYDRKKAYDYTVKLDDKKEELEVIISDADQMINEMNKFSDYIVTQMELKNEEMTTSLKTFEEKLNRVNNRITENNLDCFISNDVAVNGNQIETLNEIVNIQSNKVLNKKYEDALTSNMNHSTHQYPKNQNKIKEKVIPINNKYNRVIQLSQNGLSDTEIAKNLNMGKGEVQLILEMNK